MAQDLYETLEIPDNANEAWVRRAADLKRKALMADKSVSDERLKAKLLIVDKALNVLTNPAARERYDEQRHVTAKNPASARGGFPLWLFVGGLLFLLAGAGLFWKHSVEMEKIRIEAERVA